MLQAFAQRTCHQGKSQKRFHSPVGPSRKELIIQSRSVALRVSHKYSPQGTPPQSQGPGQLPSPCGKPGV